MPPRLISALRAYLAHHASRITGSGQDSNLDFDFDNWNNAGTEEL
jgi:hypothetical protein